MTLISDIVENVIIANLDNTLAVKEVFPVINDRQKVLFCNKKWMQLFDGVFNDGTPVVILEYDGPYVIFEVSEEAQEFTLLSTVTIPKPIFFNGTLSNTKLEWNKFSLDEKDKLPFIWLVSPTPEINNNKDTGIAKSSPMKLWFVHWSDWTKLNADRQDEAIRPLMALVKAFVDAIDKLTYIFEGYDNYTTTDFPKFGTQNVDGIENAIFDSTLSAVELDILVRIFANYCQNC